MIRSRWRQEFENACGKWPRPPLKQNGLDRAIREEEDLDVEANRFTLDKLEQIK